MNNKELVNIANSSRKTKTYIKMNIIENLKYDFTILELFEHIGEAKMFSYILTTAQKEVNNYYRHDFNSKIELENRFDIKESTQFKYLKLLISKGLICKIQNGIYKVSEKYIELWQKQ
jgi:hypothetical protein